MSGQQTSNKAVVTRLLNAFIDTGLKQQLRSNGHARLICLGGVANADLDSSARMAVEYDFDVTVVSDLVSAYNAKDRKNAMEITLPRIVSRVMTSDKVLSEVSPRF